MSDHLPILRQILAESLNLEDKGASLKSSTALLGAMPEMDSMTVVTIITALEEHFDLMISDTEIGPEHLETVGTLLRFVDEKTGITDTVRYSPAMKPEFLELPSGRLFTLHYIPDTPGDKPVIVLCPPFAEELNKSRRQISVQARAFRDAGYPVLVFDLYGTGDSEGTFVDTSIHRWQENYRDVLRWLKSTGFEACILWAVRFGALFVDDIVASGILPVKHVLLWQAEFSGEQALRQFLRLQSAANILSSSKGKSVVELEQQLTQGNEAEVAGYGISSALYTEAKKLRLTHTHFAHSTDVTWLHVLSAPQTSPPERVNKLISQWQTYRPAAILIHIDGANFWAPADLVVIPELVVKSVSAITQSAATAQRSDQDE